MLHTFAYRSSSSGVLGYSRINAINDGWLQSTDNAYVFPIDMCLYTWMVMRDDLNTSRFKLEASHWRKVGFPTFTPCLGRVSAGFVDTILPVLPPKTQLKFIKLDPHYAFIDDSSEALLATGICLWAGDCNTNIAPGDCFTLRFTCLVRTLANIWCQGILTPEEPLPVGRYQVIGMKANQGASTGLLARLLFVNQTNRPGVPIQIGDDTLLPQYWRYGNFGVFGEFEHQNIPIVDLLTSVDGLHAPTIDLDLIKIR